MENELIKITTNEEGKQLVSARELHEFLGLQKRFSAWIEQYIKEDNEYMFVEGEDFVGCTQKYTANQHGAIAERQDYAITIQMAKEISMVTKNEKGKQARKYFILCEKQLKNNKPALSREQELVLAIYNGGVESVQAAKELTEMKVKEAVEPLNNKIELDRPKVEFTETILKSKDNILVRELAKIISDEVVKIGQNKLYDKLREWNYIMKGKTEPYQSAIDKGYFVVKESKVETPYGVKLTKTTLVTPLGQIKIVEKFRREYNLTIDK